tara:strand:- start:19 stop:387 length:369 start_codon:yes stop_codon:yes gene_type:complete
MEEIKNRIDLNNFIKNNSNSHIIIKVGAEWCGPCKKMKPVFNELLCELGENNKENSIIYLEMDADKDRDCCSYLKVKGIPHVMYIKDGLLNQSMVGFEEKKLCRLFKYIDDSIKTSNIQKTI